MIITDSDWKWAESALRFRDIIPQKGTKMNETISKPLDTDKELDLKFSKMFGIPLPADGEIKKLPDPKETIQVDEDFEDAPKTASDDAKLPL